MTDKIADTNIARAEKMRRSRSVSDLAGVQISACDSVVFQREKERVKRSGDDLETLLLACVNPQLQLILQWLPK